METGAEYLVMHFVFMSTIVGSAGEKMDCLADFILLKTVFAIKYIIYAT